MIIKIDNLTDLELKLIQIMLRKFDGIELVDFINICRIAPLPAVRDIGNKLKDANSEYIIFSIFSMN